MTTTEKAFASAMPAPSALPSSSSPAMDATPKFNVNDIVMHFGRQYYTMLSCEPERLHCFYGKQSSMLHCQEDDVDASICVGIDEINQRVMSMGYNGARVVVSNIDCQQTLNGGIIIFVLGTMHWAALAPRKFVQTFLLAEQPNGYYVLNDILRLLTTSPVDTLVSQSNAAPAAVKPKSLQTPTANDAVVPTGGRTAAACVPEENVKAPAVEQARPTASAKAVPAKASHPAVTHTSIAAERAAAAAVTVAVEKAAEASTEKIDAAAEASALSSWASLAAGQQGRWKSGVVVPTESKNAAAATAPTDTYIRSAPKDTISAQKAPSASASSSVRRVAYRTSTINKEEATAPTVKEDSTSSADSSKKAIMPRDRNVTSPQASGPATATAGSAPGKAVRTERAERSDDRTPREKRDPPSYDIAKSVYVSAIDGKADRDELRKLFETFGTIKSCDILTSKGVAFVEYISVESQQAALKGSLSYNSLPLHIEARRSASLTRRPLRSSIPPKQIQA